MAKRKQAAERNAAEPDFLVALTAGRGEDFFLYGGQCRATGNCTWIEVDRNQVECQAAAGDGGEEIGADEICCTWSACC